jgi:hypothetical protein
LAATQSPSEVVTDAQARYFGIALNDRSFTPRNNARIGPTGFEAWLNAMPKPLHI